MVIPRLEVFTIVEGMSAFFSRRNFACVFHAVSLSSFQRGRPELMPPSFKRLSRDPDHVVSGRINWRAVKRRLFLVAPKPVGFRVIAFRLTEPSFAGYPP